MYIVTQDSIWYLVKTFHAFDSTFDRNAQEAAETITAIGGILPLTNPRIIQQREQAVKEIYELLIHPETSAVVLTGIAGLGKSTLAALVYKYAEMRREVSMGPFNAQACWMNIEPTTTLVDIGQFILKALGIVKEDFAKLAPLYQARTLFDALNTTDNPRLVVLNQFEYLLDMSTGQTRQDRPGVGEWIDLLNDGQSSCRLLLTSRPWPTGTRPFASPASMQEYRVKELSIPEGVKLLRTRGVEETQGTEKELEQTVEKCNGHALSLTLLASILRLNRAITMQDLFTKSRYSSLWEKHIASNFLDLIYEQQLNDIQRNLLLAFSVYREPAPLEAVEAIIAPQFEGLEETIDESINKLLNQYLLEVAGHLHYRLHAIVAAYARDHFDKESKEANKKALQAAHVRVVQYYLQQISLQLSDEEIPNPEEVGNATVSQPQEPNPREIHAITEAAWHLCQAEKWQDAYQLLDDKKMFATLRRYGNPFPEVEGGGNTISILLELYELLLRPLKEWCLNRTQQADIYTDVGSLHRRRGEKELARSYYQLALKLYHEEEARKDEARSLTYIGRVYADLGQKEEAEHYCTNALKIAQEHRYLKEEGRALAELGRIYNAWGQKKRALAYYRGALDIMQKIGDDQGEGRVWNLLSRVFRALEKHRVAKGCSLKALKILREADDQVEIGRTLSNLSRVHCALREYADALNCCDEALKTLRRTGDRGWEGKTLSNMALVYDKTGDDEAALRKYREALAILDEVKDIGTKAGTLNRKGRFYADRGQPEEALKNYKEALDLYKQIKDQWEEATTLNNIGLLYLAKEQFKTALAYFKYAMSIFTEVERPYHPTTNQHITKIQKKIGDNEFNALLAEIDDLQAVQIVAQTLNQVSVTVV